MKTSIIKHITIIFCFLLLSPTLSLAQEVERTPQEMHDMFMKKHKKKKIVGFVTLGTGVALVATGIIVTKYGSGISGPGVGLIAGGLITSLVSIPFFLGARRSKKKADLVLNQKRVVLGVSNSSNNYSLSATFSF